jgi:hypothetical protein
MDNDSEVDGRVPDRRVVEAERSMAAADGFEGRAHLDLQVMNQVKATQAVANALLAISHRLNVVAMQGSIGSNEISDMLGGIQDRIDEKG